MIRPCPTKVICLPCAGDDSNPVANLSSEAPDTGIFPAMDFRHIPPINPNVWTSAYCTTFCESQFSQNDADDCARRASYRCINPPNVSGGVDDPPYTNGPVVCQNTDSFCEIAGGTILAQSQADADAIAGSICNYRLNNGSCSTPTGGGGGGGTPEPDPNCPPETGAPTPLTLAIPEDTIVGWQPIYIPAPETLEHWPTPDDGPRYVVETHDYPPGHYTIKYFDLGTSSGVWRTEFETDPNELQYGSGGFDLCDDEHNCTVPSLPLANTEFNFLDFYTLDPDESNTAATDSRDFWLTPPSYMWDVQEEHSNADSRFFFSTTVNFDTFCFTSYLDRPPEQGGRWIGVPGKRQLYHLYQLDGLIAQPRRLAVSGYNADLIDQFADPAAAAAWGGLIPTRVTYETANPTQASWIADPNGPFGGVVLSYTSAHPTSANGRGWVLRIYSGFTVMWEGFRGVGSTPIGRFYQSAATPVGPSCLVLYDVTGKIWYTGTEPPA